jgi:hypothetical protein
MKIFLIEKFDKNFLDLISDPKNSIVLISKNK